jgi:diguanylate cyclase (GGDEF)-like protein/PAS domain S-box-containing protein
MAAIMHTRQPSLVLVLTDTASDAHSLQAAVDRAHDGPFELIWVRRLQQAVARLKQGPVHAILADPNVPDSQGLATFEALQEAAPGVPILTLCDLDGEDTARAAVRLGAQGFLTKGFFDNALVPQALRNVIERKAAENRLYMERARAHFTLQAISDAVISTDLEGRIEYMNTAGEAMTGWRLDEARGRKVEEVMELINAHTRELVTNPLQGVLASEQREPREPLAPDTLIVVRGGVELAIEDSVAPIVDSAGQVQGAVMVCHDVTAALALAHRSEYLATHDFLTSLPNRFLLGDRIMQAIALARRHRQAIAVLFIDLDNFKHINDSLGHDIGDALLQSVARRLSGCVRRSDTVSRLGGDEFVVVLVEESAADGAAAIADKMQAALAEPHQISGHQLHVSASIGISTFPDDGDSADQLLKHADAAMYQAKRQGRNMYQFFSPEINSRATERQLIEANLHRALGAAEFELYFQPQVDLDSGSISGSEALIRWHHPQWGLTLPVRFIHVAEDCGLIVPIGRWVLREACQQIRRWRDSGILFGKVSVNVSSVELRHKDFVAFVGAVIDETGLLPGSLQMEITESVLMRDTVAMGRVLAALKEMGIELAVDDFGTGYASLTYLMQFPIDVLKIDQSFVQHVADVEQSGILVSALIAMGTNLRYRMIAEGVEQDSQLEFLREHHCNEGQGFLFGQALPAAQFTSRLAARAPA